MDNSKRQPWWRREFFRFHLPPIAFALLIILLSSIPNIKGPELKGLPLDKFAHIVEFGILAFLLFRSAVVLVGKRRHVQAAATAFLLSTAFGALTEWYQSLIPGREPDVYDFVADALGAAAVSALLLIIRIRR